MCPARTGGQRRHEHVNINLVLMDRASLAVLQAVSHVLNERRPSPHAVKVVTEYAAQNLPEKSDLPLDELATFVAMKLMNIDPGSRLD